MSDGITDMYREERRYEEYHQKRREEGKKYKFLNVMLLVDEGGVYIHTGRQEIRLWMTATT